MAVFHIRRSPTYGTAPCSTCQKKREVRFVLVTTNNNQMRHYCPVCTATTNGPRPDEQRLLLENRLVVRVTGGA